MYSAGLVPNRMVAPSPPQFYCPVSAQALNKGRHVYMDETQYCSRFKSSPTPGSGSNEGFQFQTKPNGLELKLEVTVLVPEEVEVGHQSSGAAELNPGANVLS